jgi:hypothetical protein
VSDANLELARRLDLTVREVPGVTTVFATDAAVVRTARQLASGADAVPLVSVTTSDDGLAIVASIGVTGAELAPVTASIVAAAIRAELPVGLDATVSVRISRIAD